MHITNIQIQKSIIRRKRRNNRVIEPNTILTLHYFDYKQAFTGSDKNMRYKMMKIDNDKLLVEHWPGPYAYEYTDEEKKVREEFPFNDEGKIKAVDWLNEQFRLYYT